MSLTASSGGFEKGRQAQSRQSSFYASRVLLSLYYETSNQPSARSLLTCFAVELSLPAVNDETEGSMSDDQHY